MSLISLICLKLQILIFTYYSIPGFGWIVVANIITDYHCFTFLCIFVGRGKKSISISIWKQRILLLSEEQLHWIEFFRSNRPDLFLVTEVRAFQYLENNA
jgi:hypothetical protein